MTVPDRSDDRLDDAEVARVLRRAVELDAKRGALVGVEDLREIAGEVGISLESLNDALEEVRLARTSGLAPNAAAPAEVAAAPSAAAGPVSLDALITEARPLVELLRSAGLIIGGFALGWLGWTSGTRHWALITSVVVIGLGLETARRHQRTGTQWRFQMDNLWLWTANLAGMIAAAPHVSTEPVMLSLLGWASLAVAGGAAIAGTARRTTGFFRSLFGREERAGRA